MSAILREAGMRHIRTPQMELGEIRIEDIELDLKSRDDIPALLPGLQHLYSDETFRVRLFALMDEYMLPGIGRKVGRPGMEMWRIVGESGSVAPPVLGVRRGAQWCRFRQFASGCTRNAHARGFDLRACLRMGTHG